MIDCKTFSLLLAAPLATSIGYQYVSVAY